MSYNFDVRHEDAWLTFSLSVMTCRISTRNLSQAVSIQEISGFFFLGPGSLAEGTSVFGRKTQVRLKRFSHESLCGIARDFGTRMYVSRLKLLFLNGQFRSSAGFFRTITLELDGGCLVSLYYS